MSIQPKTIQSNTIAAFAQNYTTKKLADGVIQYSNDSTLIYQKPIRTAFSTEHSPLDCWKAEGFTIDKIVKVDDPIAPHYKAQLIKGDEKLWTIWWYQTHNKRTIEMWDWRKATLLSKHKTYLINITYRSQPCDGSVL